MPIHGLKKPVVLVATAACAAPIHGLKDPVLGLKELVVLVAAAASAPVGSSISRKLPDPSGKHIPKKEKQGKKGISYKHKKFVYNMTAAKSNLNLDPSTNVMGIIAATTSSSPATAQLPSPNKNELK